MYINQFDCSVHELGLVVIPTAPWLGFSPDGIAYVDDQPSHLLEIKCVTAGEQHSIEELMLSKKIPYLKLDGDEIKLKEKHAYFGQCQLGLGLLNLPFCHFIVFCRTSGITVLTVHRDEDFFLKLVVKLKDVYFKFMLPELTEQTN